MVSIIIPTYKEEGYIEDRLKNLAPLKEGFEVIISDSCSPDRTVEIAKKYTDKIVVMQPDKKRGICQGKNDGARLAKGDYLVFSDADVTFPDPVHFFKKALKAFEEDPELLAVTARIRITDARFGEKLVYAFVNSYFAIFNNVFNFGMSGGEFQMFRASAFREARGFDENLAAAEDMDIFHRLAKRGHVRTIWSLTIYQTARRFRKYGIWRTIWHWSKNAISLWFFKKSADKEWEVVR